MTARHRSEIPPSEGGARTRLFDSEFGLLYDSATDDRSLSDVMRALAESREARPDA